MLKIPEETFINEYLSKKLYFKENKHLGISAGQLEMELKLSPDESELHMRNRYLGVSKLLKDKFESSWSKIAWKQDSSYLSFTLRLPDFPVVLKPDVVQKIIPGQALSTYCLLPLSIELSAEGSKLGEYPTTVLSKTWFGELDQGLLGYSLKSQVLSNVEILPESMIHALCRINIENKSPELLCFERLCLKTDYMGLFKLEKMKGICTSQCNLTHTGNERMSKVSYAPPGPQKAAIVVSPPRQSQNHNLVFKAFKTV
jgi:hypothetical protein